MAVSVNNGTCIFMMFCKTSAYSWLIAEYQRLISNTTWRLWVCWCDTTEWCCCLPSRLLTVRGTVLYVPQDSGIRTTHAWCLWPWLFMRMKMRHGLCLHVCCALGTGQCACSCLWLAVETKSREAAPGWMCHPAFVCMCLIDQGLTTVICCYTTFEVELLLNNKHQLWRASTPACVPALECDLWRAECLITHLMGQRAAAGCVPSWCWHLLWTLSSLIVTWSLRCVIFVLVDSIDRDCIDASVWRGKDSSPPPPKLPLNPHTSYFCFQGERVNWFSCFHYIILLRTRNQ
jgi:hypothetical protein